MVASFTNSIMFIISFLLHPQPFLFCCIPNLSLWLHAPIASSLLSRLNAPIAFTLLSRHPLHLNAPIAFTLLSRHPLHLNAPIAFTLLSRHPLHLFNFFFRPAPLALSSLRPLDEPDRN
jgi:hypothetical protein